MWNVEHHYCRKKNQDFIANSTTAYRRNLSRAALPSTSSSGIHQRFTPTAQCLDAPGVDHLAGETTMTHPARHETTETRTDDVAEALGKSIRTVPRGEMTGGTTSENANANDGETENGTPETASKVFDDQLRHVLGVQTNLLLVLKLRNPSTKQSPTSSLLAYSRLRPTL